LFRHYIIIQNRENEEIFAIVNTETYNQRVREVLRERYSSGPFYIRENFEYDVYVANESQKNFIGTASKDMIEKGFPKIFEYFEGMSLLN
jgi:hypothetical protein